MHNSITLNATRVLLLILSVFSADITNAEHQLQVNYDFGEVKRDTKILGGVEAYPHEFPWLVNLRKNGQVFCCGSIIKPSLVLTAAHCVVDIKSSDQISVVAGDHRLLIENKDTEQIRRASQMVYHKNFSSNINRMVNDIAVIIVETPFIFDEYVKPIALPTKFSTENGLVIVAGWGSLLETPAEISNVLMKAELNIVSLDYCKKSYEASKISITESMLCASRWGKDSCHGDDGGPLICNTSWPYEPYTFVCGIVSFGIGCGREEFPGVYTKVSAFVEWIESIELPSSAPCLHFINALILASFISTHYFFSSFNTVK